MSNPQAPASLALVVVDLMPRVIEQEMAPYGGAAVLERAVQLADAFRAAGLPVALVHTERPNVSEQPPGGGLAAELVPEDGDIVAVKRTVGALHGTRLADALRERGADTLVLVGLATSMGVESTARAASDAGFELVFPEDAMSGMTASEHENSVTRIFPRFGEVTTTAEVLTRI
ncbi:MAG TPA: isochorismatase family protein [Nocardioides sp.]|nr:isochorismatase family protein [Nocardioides sp.]